MEGQRTEEQYFSAAAAEPELGQCVVDYRRDYAQWVIRCRSGLGVVHITEEAADCDPRRASPARI